MHLSEKKTAIKKCTSVAVKECLKRFEVKLYIQRNIDREGDQLMLWRKTAVVAARQQVG